MPPAKLQAPTVTLPANGHVSDPLDCSKRQLISGYQCKYLMCAIGCVYNTGTPGLAQAPVYFVTA